MGGRKRTGGVRLRGGTWFYGFRLRSGALHERAVPRPDDARVAYDAAWAELYCAGRVHAYQAGTWDPERAAPDVAPPADPTVAEHVRAWLATQTYEAAPKDRARAERYVAGAPFGQLRVREVRPRHAAEWIVWLKSRRFGRGDAPGDAVLSASAVRAPFDFVQRAFDAAIVAELLSSNPCRLVRKELPARVDKHPGAREGWTFTRAEIERLISDPALKPDRRVRYAILFLTGMRFGEFAALRWRDWNRDVGPLTRLTVGRAIKSVSRREGGTKTGAVKLVPVHPTLAAILAEWQLGGWPAAFGRAPAPDDYVLPSVRGRKKGRPMNGSAANRAFKSDQVALGMTPRHQHCARHAFVTLAQDDGADGPLLKWTTHAPPKSGQDNYNRGPWKRLCEELGKLRIERHAGAVVVPLEQRRKGSGT